MEHGRRKLPILYFDYFLSFLIYIYHYIYSLDSECPTNILKLAIAIEQESSDGTQQVMYYDPGVGTSGAVDKIVGGGLGEGIDVNIKELYTFLAINYDEGDEVYLFGFSRGSYTIRSLSGMIYEAGLLRRDQIQYVNDAYELYRDNEDVESERAVAFRAKHGDRIPITLLACFDTVGSLGLPFEGPGFMSKINKARYGFHTTRLSPNVQNAIHMLAIDEKNSMFKPTLMNPTNDEDIEQLTQTYFWGEHGGVGGGDGTQIINAATSLIFLVDEMERRGLGLAVNLEVVPDEHMKPKKTEPVQKSIGEHVMGGIIGMIANVTGVHVREITDIAAVHPVAIKRYQEIESWRPPALAHLEEEILNFPKEKLDEMIAKYNPICWTPEVEKEEESKK